MNFFKSASLGAVEYQASGHVYRSFLQSNSLWSIIFAITKVSKSSEMQFLNCCATDVFSLYDIAKEVARFHSVPFIATKFDGSAIVDFYAGKNDALRSFLGPNSNNMMRFDPSRWMDIRAR